MVDVDELEVAREINSPRTNYVGSSSSLALFVHFNPKIDVVKFT